jgi:hypothetical protein
VPGIGCVEISSSSLGKTGQKFSISTTNPLTWCNLIAVRVLAPYWLAFTSLGFLSPIGISDAGAQQPAPTSATAVGTVFDSVRLRPLSGAIVRLDTSELTAVVDANGRFRLEGIPVGRHQLRVEHPMLDTLGIALRSPTEQYLAGATLVAELALPAPETIIPMLCSAAWRARGPAVLVGKVREADTGVPAMDAKVSLVWYEIDVTAGVRRVPRVREVTVGPDGLYRFCGLPAQLDGKLQVLRGSLTSGDIPIAFGQDLLTLRSMSIAPAGSVAATAGDSAKAVAPVLVGSARLLGRVVNNAGRALPGARVQLEGTTRVATTRADGNFVLDSLPPGTQSVSVRLLGYAPTEQPVELSSREPRNLTIRMSDFVPMLEAVRVTAQRERALDQVGFSRRKRTGMGHYLDGDQINTNAINFSDVVRIAPGIRVVPVGQRNMITSARDPNGCVAVYIDGSMWQQLEPGDVDDFVKPHELAALEIYSATNTPAEFTSARQGSCMTIVAWTVRRLDRKR